MSWIKAIPVLGSIIDKVITNKAEANAAKAELLSEAVQAELATISAQADVIKTEMQGSTLQRNWRPVMMLMFGSMILNNYILAPYMNFYFEGSLPVLDLPEHIWTLVDISMGGYIVGRSGEKIVDKLKYK